MIKSSLIIFIILLVHVSFAQIQFQENVLFQRQLQDPSRVIGFDVDGDFDNDMLITDPLKNRIIWIENSGNSLFQNLHVLIDNFGYPADTEIYDIDGDGILDILVSDNSTNKLRWLRNNGLGSFTIKNIDTISSSPKGAVCADLDNDGDWDILCTSFLGNQILAYYNDGTGNFGPKQIVSAEVSFPIDVQGVDIDGDDLKDIVSLCYIGSKLAWYKNLGNNNFSAQIVIAGPSQLSYPRCLSTADLDGDDIMEIVTSSITGALTREILVFENSGFGAFIVQQTLPTDYSNHESYTIDLDADADIDILTPTDIYLNDGTGSFSYNRVDSIPSRITTADFNGDSLLDLAYCFNTCNLAWKVNLGSGNFGNRQLIFNTILNVRELIYNDLDNDGLKDILVGAGDKFISICTYKNMGNGTYALADTILTGCTSVYSMEMIDLDGDGLQDLLMQIRQNVVDKIAWQKRLPSGDFGPIQVIKDSLVQFCEVHAADIDGDGDADILYGAYISGNQSTLNLITNDGFGYFGADIVLRQGVWQARDLQTIDINNDGKLDVFFTDLRLMVGINLGTSSNFQFYNVGSNTDDAQAFSFADLDGDLDMDIVYACGSSTISVGSHIGILENTGVLTATGFVSTTLYPAWETDEIALKDLDMDGDIDIIAEQYSASPSLFWMQNDGAGNFSQGMLSPVIAVADSIHATSIVIDDLDGDSDMDILYCSDFLGNFLFSLGGKHWISDN